MTTAASAGYLLYLVVAALLVLFWRTWDEFPMHQQQVAVV